MLTKRDYWTITSLILVVALLFQLINVARKSDDLDGSAWEAQSVAQEAAIELSAGDGDI